MPSSTVESIVEAPRSLVFDVFADRERSGEYLPMRTRLERHGAHARQGVGAVHFLGFGRFGIREEIVELVPDERMVYRVLSGLPVKEHVGTIEFADHQLGTRVRYTMETVPALPVPAGLVRAILRRMITTMLDGARSGAEVRAQS